MSACCLNVWNLIFCKCVSKVFQGGSSGRATLKGRSVKMWLYLGEGTRFSMCMQIHRRTYPQIPPLSKLPKTEISHRVENNDILLCSLVCGNTVKRHLPSSISQKSYVKHEPTKPLLLSWYWNALPVVKFLIFFSHIDM